MLSGTRSYPVMFSDPATTNSESHDRRDADGSRVAFGWASLTDTERSVARVVAEGLTNRLRRRAPFQSRHTVEFPLAVDRPKARHPNSRAHLTRLVLTHHAPDGA
jgi:DNA-binding CsgD family transcriptional regulator